MESRQRTKIKMLFKRLLGMENEAERRELDAWLEEHPRDRRWVESMDGGREYLRRLEFLRRLNTEKELRGAMRGTSGRRVRWGWWAAAAVVFLTVGASAYLYLQERDWTPERIDADPGSFGAVLVASDGSLHDLLTRRDTIEVRYDHFVVADSAGLTYAELPSAGQAEEEEEVVEYNRLLVNRGHEYMLTLHDGTRVWLNSESDLEYPVTFPRGERRVRLNGEAYFEVAKDSLSPFIVEVGRGFDVRVLGTSFNVKAYPTDERYETTLVEGSVNVTDSAGMDVTLSPSEQLVLTRGGSYMVYDVDPRYYLAWHEGWFFFHDEPMRQVLLMIGRWYNVEFECEEGFSIDDKWVTGKVRRFERLEELLGMLAKVTDVRFKEKDGRILLRHKDK